MPDGIPRNTRHFDSSVLPIPHQSGLCLSQQIWQRRTWFLGRNVPCGDGRLFFMFQGGGFGMTSCVVTARPAGIVVQISATGSEVFQHGESAQDGPVALPPSGFRATLLHIFYCGAVWGPPRENPGPRPNDRCLTPCTKGRFCCDVPAP